MAIWTVVGISLFWLGWPWLWYDSWNEAPGLSGAPAWRGTTIMVQYFGQVVADRDVPWHYPWFYFAATVPVGLQALGAVGARAGLEEPPRRPVSVAPGRNDRGFPGAFQHAGAGLRRRTSVPACLSGLGAVDRTGFWLALEPRLEPVAAAALVLGGFLLVQSYGVVALHPFGLSYYNGLVGGLPGAERLGLELTYWNDPVDQVLLDQLAAAARPEASAALVPTLYPGQGVLTTNRALAQRRIILADEQEGTRAEWVVLSRRTAYWRPEIKERLRLGEGRRVATRSRQGVWLAALWHFPAPQARTPSAAAHGSAPTSVRAPITPIRRPIRIHVQISTLLPDKDLRNLLPSL